MMLTHRSAWHQGHFHQFDYKHWMDASGSWAGAGSHHHCNDMVMQYWIWISDGSYWKCIEVAVVGKFLMMISGEVDHLDVVDRGELSLV